MLELEQVMTRAQVLDANDLLDAIQEAEEDEKEKAKREQEGLGGKTRASAGKR